MEAVCETVGKGVAEKDAHAADDLDQQSKAELMRLRTLVEAYL
jgi:hypothetical protein